MTTEDDPENDPLMRSMRSVWLGMRDEEPSERGLSDLMSAARVQADAMKPKEAWWRKSLVFLMRPPVLAAAAVVVVIGGAVALKGRGADEAAAPTISSGLRVETERRQDPELGFDEKAKIATESPVDPRADVAQAGSGTVTATPTIPRAGPKKPPPKPVVIGDNFGKEDGPKGGETAPPPPPPPPDTGESGLLIAGEGKDTTKDVPNGKIAVDKQPTTNRPSPQPAKVDSVDDLGQAQVRPGRTDSTDQLVKQAETAAARNDCPAVRATAARIKKTSPETYKTKVATKPAIARCLK